MKFDYYYGAESNQFTFYRIPKVLFTDKSFSKLSCEAKVLYGLFIDRMGLSMKNGWVDEEDRVYIYFKQDEAKDFLGCGLKKCNAIFSELADVGLIEKKRQGLGKPDCIYVKNFIKSEAPEPEPPEKITSCDSQYQEKMEVEKTRESEQNPDMSKSHLQTCQNDASGHFTRENPVKSQVHIQKCNIDTSRQVKSTHQDMSKRHTNDNNINNTEKNNVFKVCVNSKNARTYPTYPENGPGDKETSKETLTGEEYASLVSEFGEKETNRVLNRARAYSPGCVIYDTLKTWLTEDKERRQKLGDKSIKKNKFCNCTQRQYDMASLERDLLMGQKNKTD